jgi:hypothetical protein
MVTTVLLLNMFWSTLTFDSVNPIRSRLKEVNRTQSSAEKLNAMKREVSEELELFAERNRHTQERLHRRVNELRLILEAKKASK